MYSEDEKIKNIQKSLLILLTEFDKICTENDLKYSLHGGTLLGAIREKGFIPWDDDADLTMDRKYYDKFLSLMKENPYGTKIVIVRNVPRFMDPSVSDDLGMDIFVYDPISQNKLLQKLKIYRLLAVDAITRSKAEMNNMANDIHKKWEIFIFKFVNFLGKILTKNYRNKLHDKVAQHFCTGNGAYIHRSNDQKAGVGVILKKEWMSEYTYVPFETCNFMITKNYHEVLATAYGDNYMTPIKDEKQSGHHEKMRQFLKDSE